jgi:light-regulated signal transduction histidine kinase (bacteriophytochrome)
VRWLRILATPVDAGSGCLWDGVALDVTLAKQAEIERGRLKEELERLHRTQTTNRIALSLGTDLAQIWAPLRQNAEALMRDLAPDSPLYKRANEIRAVGERARRLAEQLALMRDGERASAPVDLVERLESRVESLRRELPAGLVLETSFGARGTTVRCAAADQLVENLAVYVAETLGAEPGVITIGTNLQTSDADRGRHLRIAICDARSGLASRTFSKVLRLRSSRMEKVSGEELSLAIVRLVVDAAQGWVQSGVAEQGGSVLEIFLPVWDGLGQNVIRLERSVR